MSVQLERAAIADLEDTAFATLLGNMEVVAPSLT